MKICAVIPTYNNVTTAASVVRTVMEHLPVIVVVDGSTDGTLESLQAIDDDCLTIVSYKENRGKGYALKTGFRKAREMGFTHVLTMDSDGQHLTSEIPAMLRMARIHTDSIILGSRKLRHRNMPAKNTFANRFSNFWFAVQTGRALPDTQTGMRVYPLGRVRGERFMTNRYEAELLLLVCSAWANVQIIPQPIEVFYPELTERVSFFSPLKDFTRISILNTLLCIVAVLYGLPRRWLPTVYYGVVFLLDSLLFIKPFLIYCRLTGKWALAHRVLRSNAWFLLKALPGNPYKILYDEGATPIGANGPEVVICNHNSFLDSQVLLTLNIDMVCIVSPRHGRNIFFGSAVKASGAVFTDRPIEEILDELRTEVAKGRSIVIYPEGTRSLTGAIGYFHSGAFYIAEQLGLPLRPLFQWDMQQIFGKMEFHIGLAKCNIVKIFNIVKVVDYKKSRREMQAWYREIEEQTENFN